MKSQISRARVVLAIPLVSSVLLVLPVAGRGGQQNPVASVRAGENADGIWEHVIAAATPDRPRHSEGDLVVLRDGTLLLAWTEFTGGRGDHAGAHISAVKSSDEGRTWGAPFVLQENIGRQNVMSVSLLRLNSGEILHFFLVKNSLTDLKLVVRRSNDETRTWSDPVVVTPGPGYYGMANARAIQLKDGRIICPMSYVPDAGIRGTSCPSVIFYSDDSGRTWTRGRGEVACPKRGAMEPHVVELNDGTVLQIIRTQMAEIWCARSGDRGDTWSEAAPMGVVAPESPSTITRLPGAGELLMVFNPSVERGVSGRFARTPLAFALSRDEGRTWTSPRSIESDTSCHYAYTSITFHRDRALLTYYVNPSTPNQLSLKFKSIPLVWFRTNP